MKWVKALVAVLAALFLVAGCGSGGAGAGAGSGGGAGSGNVYENVRSTGRLRIGTEGTYPPFTYHDAAGNLTGYDVEVGRAIAAEMGVEAEFVEARWDSLIMGLDNNQWDVVINQVGVTDERSAQYDFSTPYSFGYPAIIVRADETRIGSFEDLAGKHVAQAVTSEYAYLAENYGAILVGTDGFAQSIELLTSERADATINSNLVFYDYLHQHPDAPIKIAATGSTPTEYAVIMRQNEPELRQAIDDALQRLRDNGTLAEISHRYFDMDISIER